jgi:hypothetical protein
MPLKDMKELEGNIDRFLGFFSNRLQEIRNLDCGESTALFQKVLYSSMLDALSRTTSHPKKGNRERVTEFIRTFCDWATCERISLPHLVKLLDKVPDPAFSNLRQYSFSLIDQWQEGMLIPLDSDPEFQEIKSKWPKEIQKPIEDISIEFLQHVNLFYRYRNSLVHELREPGYGWDFTGNPNPYYHTMTDAESKSDTWELVYPLKFYETLCETAIKTLKGYYLQDRIEPYSCYNFGTYWIDELNR